MAEYIIQEETLTNITNIIRDKFNIEGKINFGELGQKVSDAPQLKIQFGSLNATNNVYTIPTNFTPEGFIMYVEAYEMGYGDETVIQIGHIPGMSKWCLYEENQGMFDVDLSDVTDGSTFENYAEVERLSNLTDYTETLDTLFSEVMFDAYELSYFNLTDDGIGISDLYENVIPEDPDATSVAAAYLSDIYMSQIFNSKTLAKKIGIISTTPNEIVYNSDSAVITLDSILYCRPMNYIIWGY